EADFNISVTRDAEAKGNIIKELRDPSNTHKFSFKHLMEEINKQLKGQNIPFLHSNSSGKSRDKFNSHDLSEFIKFYNMKKTLKKQIKKDNPRSKGILRHLPYSHTGTQLYPSQVVL